MIGRGLTAGFQKARQAQAEPRSDGSIRSRARSTRRRACAGLFHAPARAPGPLKPGQRQSGMNALLRKQKEENLLQSLEITEKSPLFVHLKYYQTGPISYSYIFFRKQIIQALFQQPQKLCAVEHPWVLRWGKRWRRRCPAVCASAGNETAGTGAVAVETAGRKSPT